MNTKNWQDLIKPIKLDVNAGRDRRRTATLVAEPLERGFGMTLGNSLRRVLLSSLQGAAVTSVQIDGVLHEFSSIAGVREDVTDIVLNIKLMALRMHNDGPRRLSLRATGPGELGQSLEFVAGFAVGNQLQVPVRPRERLFMASEQSQGVRDFAESGRSQRIQFLLVEKL